MNAQRNIGGSLLASSSPEILRPINYAGGILQVREIPEEDTHALFHNEDRIASHANGYSCHALAKRLSAGDLPRVMDQAAYIVDCGGKCDVDACVRALEVAHV